MPTKRRKDRKEGHIKCYGTDAQLAKIQKAAEQEHISTSLFLLLAGLERMDRGRENER